MSELKALWIPTRSGNILHCYLKDEVDAAIAELKQKLEDAKATAYAESVDAGMRERRLKRALYKACENWADAEVFSRVKSVNDDNTEANKWAVMRNKCRAMAEKFKETK